MEAGGLSLVTMAEEQPEDPYARCERNLLEHINTMHEAVEVRLDVLEEQVSGKSGALF